MSVLGSIHTQLRFCELFKSVPLSSRVLFTLNNGEHQRKQSQAQTQMLSVNGPLPVKCPVMIRFHGAIVIARATLLSLGLSDCEIHGRIWPN